MAHARTLSHTHSWQVLETWHGGLPNLLASLETERFMPVLDHLLQGISSFDQSCIFLYPAGALPVLLHDNMQDIPEPGAMHRYINGTYLLDPVYTACAHGRAAGLYRMAELAPDAFFEGEYFNSPDVHPCISLASGTLSEEIVFLSQLPGGSYAAYSLMRCNGSPAFSHDDLAALHLCQPTLEALFQRHYAKLSQLQGGRVARSSAEHLSQAFAGFASERLTAREQAIVSLILRGHSSLSISLHLEIAEGTVKNHRKHLYSKLGISSQSELFHLFVNHLLGTELVEQTVVVAEREIALQGTHNRPAR